MSTDENLLIKRLQLNRFIRRIQVRRFEVIQARKLGKPQLFSALLLIHCMIFSRSRNTQALAKTWEQLSSINMQRPARQFLIRDLEHSKGFGCLFWKHLSY